MVKAVRDGKRRRGFLGLAVLFLGACGGHTAPPPEPGTSRGTPPDVRGRRVMVLPVQLEAAITGDVDAEIAFALTGRSREVTWVLPAEIEAILDRSPAIDARTRGLPVSQFLVAEVRRVGDPLFGQLRRMAALVNAEAVILPVGATSVSDVPGQDPTVRLTVVMLETRTGRVVWFGIVEGGAFPQGDPRGLASAADALARRLLWYVGR